MTLRTLARRALNSWANWRARKAIHRAFPSITELDRDERDAVRKWHTQGIARARAAKRAAINNALRG